MNDDWSLTSWAHGRHKRPLFTPWLTLKSSKDGPRYWPVAFIEMSPEIGIQYPLLIVILSVLKMLHVEWNWMKPRPRIDYTLLRWVVFGHQASNDEIIRTKVDRLQMFLYSPLWDVLMLRPNSSNRDEGGKQRREISVNLQDYFRKLAVAQSEFEGVTNWTSLPRVRVAASSFY